MSSMSTPVCAATCERAATLWQTAIALLHEKGIWQSVEGYPNRLRAYHRGELMMLHRTPFQPVPISETAQAQGISAKMQRAAARAYGLDIWWEDRKVLSVIWNHNGPLALILFKGGIWEATLEKNAKYKRRGLRRSLKDWF